MKKLSLTFFDFEEVYMLNQEKYLHIFLEDVEVSIDNNASELFEDFVSARKTGR